MSRVVDYVVEEVERQGHNTSTLDGIERAGWMLNAWAYALKNADRPMEASDAIILGQRIEPIKNLYGMRRCNVRVGDRICPDFSSVPVLLWKLLDRHKAGLLEPLAFYREFEEIHPFVDGNGRTGKILLNWIWGTLLEPTFPPDDLFGYPLRNP